MASGEEIPGCDLRGLGVLVTRAAHQAKPLCRLVEAHGGVPIPFPAVEILGPADPQALSRLLKRMDRFQIALFISPNAVEFGLRALEGALPASLLVGAVGAGTSRALRALGVEPTLCPPDRFDSEGLLELPELRDVAGQRVLIFRGDGGRPLLGDTLRQRGAAVEYAEVYRRALPQGDPAPLIARWDEVGVVVATSSELLENLFELLGKPGPPPLRRTPVLVISERMVERARELGCTRILLAAGASERAVVERLCSAALELDGQPLP